LVPFGADGFVERDCLRFRRCTWWRTRWRIRRKTRRREGQGPPQRGITAPWVGYDRCTRTGKFLWSFGGAAAQCGAVGLIAGAFGARARAPPSICVCDGLVSPSPCTWGEETGEPGGARGSGPLRASPCAALASLVGRARGGGVVPYPCEFREDGPNYGLRCPKMGRTGTKCAESLPLSLGVSPQCRALEWVLSLWDKAPRRLVESPLSGGTNLKNPGGERRQARPSIPTEASKLERSAEQVHVRRGSAGHRDVRCSVQRVFVASIATNGPTS